MVKTKNLTLMVTAAVLAALTCVATMVVQIPMPLTQGYVNFGVAGVLIFSFLIGYFMAKTDSRFTAKNDATTKLNYFSAIYYFLIGRSFL